MNMDLIVFLKSKKLVIFVLLLLFLCFIHGLYFLYQVNKSLPQSFYKKSVTLVGVVSGIPKKKQKSYQFIFKTEIGKIRLTWYHLPKHIILQPGLKLELRMKLTKPAVIRNPGGFDYQGYLKQSGIIASGRVLSAVKVIGFYWLNAPIDAIRFYLIQSIKAHLSNKRFLGIFSALITGDKSSITLNDKIILKKTATSHLVAISGLHVGLVFFWAYLLIRFFWSISHRLSYQLSAQKVASIGALIVSIIYSLLAGFGIPTQRAIIMLLIFTYAYLMNLSVSKRYILLLAAIAIIFYNPLSLASPGFWLSFSAVMFLVFAFVGRKGQGSFLKRLFFPQWIATVCLIPLTIFYFGGFSVIGFLANLIAVPMVSFIIVPGLLVSIVLSIFNESLFRLCLSVIDMIFSWLWDFLCWLGDISWAFLSIMIYPSPYLLGLSLVGVIILFLPKGFPNRMLGSFFILPLLYYRVGFPSSLLAKLVILDVGHGLAVVFQMKDYTLVYDTGGISSSGLDMGEMVVIPYLRAIGVTMIDRLVLSHGDLDHAGGLKSILQQVLVKQLDASSNKNIPQAYHKRKTKCEEGLSWTVDQAKFTYLNTSFLSSNASSNNLSCVLKITLNQFSILIPGDIEKKAEHYLVNYHKGQLTSDILISPHHGSNSSSTMPFLEAVSPKIILIGNSQYKLKYFPHLKVIQRYQKLQANYFDTAHYGAISIKLFMNGKIMVEPFIK
ncbi:DNA internalization-related competence protein ComEC/Rec2 [Thiotrichales bacterium 19S9-12]|nr:DNA internalization-related competence protein ComEC/Rec2 [Thiotrichales bacterium 19S9-11]MCF6811550.1 DNA internalization-related competence protein ComEC/Rec2 [Thiotrichales bacterium 19S9-12]